MEEDILYPAQVNRLGGGFDVSFWSLFSSTHELQWIVYLNKKRKLEAQLLPKHVRWDQEPESGSSSDSSSEPKRMRSNIFAGDDELVTMQASRCFSYNSNFDSVASQHDNSKRTPLPCTRPHSYLDHSSSSSTWTSFSSEVNSYSLESRERETNQTSSCRLESLSIGGLHPHDNFEEQGESGLEHCIDRTRSEYPNQGMEPEDDVLNSLYYSTMIDPNAQQGTRKLTIDKEFEEYFSMLML